MLVPQRVNEAIGTMGELFILMVVLASLTVKPLLGGVWFPDPFMDELMSCLVPWLPLRLILLSLVPEHTPTTLLKWQPWLKPCSFLGPPGPVTSDEQSRIYFDYMHAAGICLGTIQARTHVQLALACQQSMIRVQHRPRLTMQHVYGHGRNLGNECTDHAAALGTFGLISSHNVSTRWVRHKFEGSVCFGGCHSISETLERLQHIRTNTETLHQDRV